MTVFFNRLAKRMLNYSGVGIGTYILDIAIVALLVYGFLINTTVALLIGFGIGVTINYLLCYYWVFKGTRRNVYLGLCIFVCLAGTGALIITLLVPFLMGHFALPLLIARTVAAGLIGTINFLINTFLNFRLV